MEVNFYRKPIVFFKKIKFLLNLDLMGTGQEGITVVNATEFQKEFGELISINSIEKLFPLIKSRGKAANSDHYWFSENNVRCFYLYNGRHKSLSRYLRRGANPSPR